MAGEYLLEQGRARTGQSDDEHQSTCFQAGARDFLKKLRSVRADQAVDEGVVPGRLEPAKERCVGQCEGISLAGVIGRGGILGSSVIHASQAKQVAHPVGPGCPRVVHQLPDLIQIGVG